MHIVTARNLQPDDVVVGTRILISHGVGYVPGEITEVRFKERTPREGDPYTEIHFGVKADVGFTTGGNFNIAGASNSTRYLVADAEVDPTEAIDAEVLDYIGCAVTCAGTSFFYPDVTDTDEVAAKFRAAVEDAGFEVFGRVSARLVTEQKVVVYTGYGDDRRPSAAVYDFASNTVSDNSGIISFDYLPVGS